MNYLFSLALSALITVGSFFGITDTQKSVQSLENRVEKVEMSSMALGAFNPSGGITYRTQTSIGTTDTTINLSSFENRSEIALTMDLLNTDIAYGTLSPQTSRSEFISFTGVTQNSNGTAQLTGVTRGLSDIYPFTASTTLRNSHPGQSVFILSDSPSLFEEYAKIRNDMAITGLWNFNSYLPTSSINATTSAQFTNKSYVDNVANAGAATSTDSNGGLVELATSDEMASSTAADTEKPRVLISDNSTSSPYGAGNWVVITDDDGNINNDFLNTERPLTWTGDVTLYASSTNLQAATTTFLTVYVDDGGLTSATSSVGIGTSSPTTLGGLSIEGSQYIDGALGIGIATTTRDPNLEVFGNLIVDGNATTTELFVGGKCNNCLSGYETIIDTDALGTSDTNVTTGTATCTSGKRVTGGGFLIDAIDYLVGSNYPNTESSWTVSVECDTTIGTCGAGNLQTYAICVWR